MRRNDPIFRERHNTTNHSTLVMIKWWFLLYDQLVLIWLLVWLFSLPPSLLVRFPRVTTMTLIPGWKAQIWTQIKHSFYILSLSANILLGLFIMISINLKWKLSYATFGPFDVVEAFSFHFLGFFTEMISTPFVLDVWILLGWVWSVTINVRAKHRLRLHKMTI